MPARHPPAPERSPLLAWLYAVVAAATITAAVFVTTPAVQIPASVGGLVFGTSALVQGFLVVRERIRVRRDLARAALEWPSLCRELAAASRRGEDLGMVLAVRGYHEPGACVSLARRARHWGQRSAQRLAIANGKTPTVAPSPTHGQFAGSPRVRLEFGDLPAEREPAIQTSIGGVVTVLCVWVMLSEPTRLWAWLLFGATIGIGMLLTGLEGGRRVASPCEGSRHGAGEQGQCRRVAAAARLPKS